MSGLNLKSFGFGDVAVTGLSCDSRQVQPGHIFAALPRPALIEPGRGMPIAT